MERMESLGQTFAAAIAILALLYWVLHQAAGPLW
jgi:hypothetical protein